MLAHAGFVLPGTLAGMPRQFILPERRLNGGGPLTAYEDELPVMYTAGVRAGISLLNIPSDAAVYQSAVNREAELRAPSRVACSDLLDGVSFISILFPNRKEAE